MARGSERRQYQTNPPRHEYVLTELGRSLRPVVVVLAAWGNARLDPDQRSMVLVDAETGTEAEPVVVDRATGRRVDGPDLCSPPAPPPANPSATATRMGRPAPNCELADGTDHGDGRSPTSTTSRRSTCSFYIIEKGLDGIADGEHFFDLLADAVIFEYIITTLRLPARRVEGRTAVAELYRPAGITVRSLVPADTPDQTSDAPRRRRCRRCGSFETGRWPLALSGVVTGLPDEQRLTLMAVHAHPDDESSSTGGVPARYADDGVRTVVVTCTNGELGDAPGGIKPGDEGHDEAEVARIRLGELERACETLGVAHLELLGYHDSGMVDWADKDRFDVFCNVAVDDAAERLSSLFERYQPDVVVTYDELGGYDHPDHVHASRVAMAAVARTGIPRKAYFTAFRRSMFERFRAVLQQQGADLSQIPDPGSGAAADGCGRSAHHNRDRCRSVRRTGGSRFTHASQIEGSFWPACRRRRSERLSEETFIRAHDTTGAPLPEADLFVGLR